MSKRLQHKLEDYFEARGLGEVFNAPIDMILGRHDVAQPDILVVTNPGQISGRGIEGALSPSTRRHDREVKMRCYAALAIPHYWIVDPDTKGIACCRLEGAAYQHVITAESDSGLAPADWPELSIPLADLWRCAPHSLSPQGRGQGEGWSSLKLPCHHPHPGPERARVMGTARGRSLAPCLGSPSCSAMTSSAAGGGGDRRGRRVPPDASRRGALMMAAAVGSSGPACYSRAG